MATKTLDKMTKAELVTLVQALQASNQTLASQNAQLLGDKARLRDALTNLESRRKYEGQCYRAAIHDGGIESRPISPRRAALEAAKREAMESGRTVHVEF